MEESKRICDFVIEPPDARNYSTFAFNKVEEIYQVGYDTTVKQVMELFKDINLEKVFELKKKGN
ncbi:MAG: hypothetical protein K0B11_12175 [Mariniphaga sp.]|nr:hypothetical protein [Mariniphaga sp.]